MNIEDYTLKGSIDGITVHNKNPIFTIDGLTNHLLIKDHVREVAKSPSFQYLSYRALSEYSLLMITMNALFIEHFLIWHDNPEAKELKYLLALGRVTIRNRVYKVSTPKDFIALVAKYRIINFLYTHLKDDCSYSIDHKQDRGIIYIMDERREDIYPQSSIINASIYDVLSDLSYLMVIPVGRNKTRHAIHLHTPHA